MISGQMERRDGFLLLLAVIIFVFCGVFYFLWYRPVLNESHSLSARQQESVQFLHKTEQIAEDKRAQAREAAAEQAGLDQGQLPKKVDQEGMLRDLEKAADLSGVKVLGASFLLEEPVTVDRPNAVSTEGESISAADGFSGLLERANQQIPGLLSIGIELRLEGSLEATKHFLAAIHSEERLYIAEAMQYKATSGEGSRTSSLRLRSFYNP